MRGTFVYRDGEMVEKHKAAPLNLGFMSRSKAVASPMLNLDTVSSFRSMADGKMYDSKAAYRASLKVHGMREIGNEIQAHVKEATASKAKPRAKGALMEAYQKVKQGYRPPPAPIVHSIGTPDLD
jgi:hypothetical protein